MVINSVGLIREEENFDDNRVALTPEGVKRLFKTNEENKDHPEFKIYFEKNAGLTAGFPDENYLDAGAEICQTREILESKSDLIISINNLIRYKSEQYDLTKIPRISRAQSMDILSSQANLAGYQAVIMAANNLNKIMPMLMTAAGKINPAKVLILGAGVAGLQAIATARRLGAVVFGYDIRPAVKEQIESLGARFVELKLDESGEGQGGYAKALSADSQKQQQVKLGEFAKDFDIIISTAQIPGRKAPVLILKDAVQNLKPGSVIIDMAAGSGGNIEGSKPDELVELNGVKVFGPTNLPSDLAKDASQVFSRNIESFLALEFNADDEIIQACKVKREL